MTSSNCTDTDPYDPATRFPVAVMIIEAVVFFGIICFIIGYCIRNSHKSKGKDNTKNNDPAQQSCAQQSVTLPSEEAGPRNGQLAEFEMATIRGTSICSSKGSFNGSDHKSIYVDKRFIVHSCSIDSKESVSRAFKAPDGWI
jgi:hypothetical protein